MELWIFHPATTGVGKKAVDIHSLKASPGAPWPRFAYEEQLFQERAPWK
jgi:hypothetical protein